MENGALQCPKKGLARRQCENRAPHIFMTPSIAEGSIRKGILKGRGLLSVSATAICIAEGSIRKGILKASLSRIAGEGQENVIAEGSIRKGILKVQAAFDLAEWRN